MEQMWQFKHHTMKFSWQDDDDEKKKKKINSNEIKQDSRQKLLTKPVSVKAILESLNH